MLEQLTAQHAIKRGLLERVKDPLGAIKEMTVRLHARVQEAFHRAKDLTLYLEQGIDRKLITDWMQSIVVLPEAERRVAFHKLFEEAMNGDFERMYSLIETLGSIDILRLAEKERGADPLTENDMLLPLQIDNELFTEVLGVAQTHPQFKDWIRFLGQKADGELDQTSEQLDELRLDGAALPEMFPKIAEYEDRITRHVQTRGGRKGKSFEVMTKAFKTIATTLFGNEVEAFYGVGTFPTFKSLALRFWKYNPDADLIACPYEYLPMWYQVAENRRHMADIPQGIDFTEEQLMDSLFRKGQEVREKRRQRGVEDNAPIVLLVSSQMRIGGKMLDTKKIAELVETENQKNAGDGRSRYHLWLDASQDSRVIKEGDIVFYSKRHGGTGGGMVLARKATYPEDSQDIKEAFRTRSGYDLKYIPRIVAALFCIDKKIGHKFANLLDPKTIGLWYFSGKGTFLEKEIEKAADAIRVGGLNKLFTMEASLPASDSGQWRIDTIVRISTTEKGHETLDLKQLEQNLKSLNVNVSSFNLEHLEGTEGNPKFSELMEMLGREPFDCAVFIEAVKKFQEYYSQAIVVSLLPTENEQDALKVKEHFLRAVKQHNYFRLFITAIDRPDTLLDFVKRLETAVDTQLDGLPLK